MTWHCLVRASTPEEGAQRLYSFLKVYDPEETLKLAFAERVRPVLGDVTQERLGLSEADYSALTDSVDTTSTRPLRPISF